MFVFQRKVNSTGEIHVILTEQDRAQLLVEGMKWIDLNDTLNDFNKDDDITDCKLCATYAGDLDDSAIRTYINNNYNDNSIVQKKPEEEKKSSNENSDKKKDKKDKVDTSGKIIKVDEDGEEWESDENLEQYLEAEALECPTCGDIGKALINKHGEILPCKSCIEIDAYLKGKKEGYSKGFEEGYNKCMKLVEKLISGNKEELDELTNVNINDLIKETEKEDNNGK